MRTIAYAVTYAMTGYDKSRLVSILCIAIYDLNNEFITLIINLADLDVINSDDIGIDY